MAEDLGQGFILIPEPKKDKDGNYLNEPEVNFDDDEKYNLEYIKNTLNEKFNGEYIRHGLLHHNCSTWTEKDNRLAS